MIILPDAERFWAKVDKAGPVVRAELGPCWVWRGAVGSDGYGGIMSKRPQRALLRAHRVAFEFERGRAPGAVLRHRCDNPLCVRPSHLLEGTHASNVRDMVIRDRVQHGEAHHAAKLALFEIKAIRKARGEGMLLKDIADYFGVSISNVSMICRGKRWRRAA